MPATPVSPIELTHHLRSRSALLGFQLCGVTPAVSPDGFQRLKSWIDAGYAGEMAYLCDRLQAYEHPRAVLDGVRSVVMLGMSYRTTEPHPVEDGSGRVARYAWGPVDYHDLIHDRLKQLRDWFTSTVPDAGVRGIVDTAPLLEREFAQLAGLGWIGKNTMLINRRMGSWFFLAALLTDQTLEYDGPHATSHCGTCRACLDACPTGAFVEPYTLDATRCISYLTIEYRDSIPDSLRSGIGDWFFGCDVCQDVCPWNRRAAASEEPGFQPAAESNPVDLGAIFYLDDHAFRRRFRKTPLWRSKRRGVLRNAAIVLGNQRYAPAVDALCRGEQDDEPLVREACTWALQQIRESEANGRADDPTDNRTI